MVPWSRWVFPPQSLWKHPQMNPEVGLPENSKYSLTNSEDWLSLHVTRVWAQSHTQQPWSNTEREATEKFKLIWRSVSLNEASSHENWLVRRKTRRKQNWQVPRLKQWWRGVLRTLGLQEGTVGTVTFELSSEGMAEKWTCADQGPWGSLLWGKQPGHSEEGNSVQSDRR